MLGNFLCFCCRMLNFFKVNFFKKKKKNQEHHQYQTCLIQIRIDILSVLIWFQLFAKVISRQQKLMLARKEFNRT